MSAANRNAVAAIARAIRTYSELHPEAADSAAGVQRWWLPVLLHEEPLPLVEAALDLLVVEGDMRRIVMDDGNVIYARTRGAA